MVAFRLMVPLSVLTVLLMKESSPLTASPSAPSMVTRTAPWLRARRTAARSCSGKLNSTPMGENWASVTRGGGGAGLRQAAGMDRHRAGARRDGRDDAGMRHQQPRAVG